MGFSMKGTRRWHSAPPAYGPQGRVLRSPFRFHALQAWVLNGRSMAGRDPALVIGALVAHHLAWAFGYAWLERSRRKTLLARIRGKRKTLLASKQEDRKTLLALERERRKRPS
jgi:hypothetical protein